MSLAFNNLSNWLVCQQTTSSFVFQSPVRQVTPDRGLFFPADAVSREKAANGAKGKETRSAKCGMPKQTRMEG